MKRLAALLRRFADWLDPPPRPLSDWIANINPDDTPVLTDPAFKLCDWRDE